MPGPVSAGLSPRLVTGLRFDVLDVPAEAGFAALRHRGQTRAPRSPVALSGDRMLLLVAAGSADELPGLLDWLEWGRLTPDLRAIGAGGDIEAPLPPGRPGQPGPPVAAGDFPGRTNPQGAALWLRPPETGRGTEIPLPTMSALGASEAPPISYGWWTRWRRNAIASDCGARALSRWPSRKPREWMREHGHGR